MGPLRCLAHGALVLISLFWFLPRTQKPQSSFSSSRCPTPLHPHLNDPLVLWTAVREACGSWAKHWAELTGEGKRRNAAERWEVNWMEASCCPVGSVDMNINTLHYTLCTAGRAGHEDSKLHWSVCTFPPPSLSFSGTYPTFHSVLLKFV